MVIVSFKEMEFFYITENMIQDHTKAKVEGRIFDVEMIEKILLKASKVKMKNKPLELFLVKIGLKKVRKSKKRR